MTARLCSRCKERPAGRYKSGKHAGEPTYCRECRNEKARNRCLNDGERMRELARRRYASNPEKHRDEHRRWRNANPEKFAKINQRWRDHHPFVYAAISLEHNSGTWIPPLSLWGLFKRQRGRCAMTGRALNLRGHPRASLDHRVPRSRSGETTPENLQWVSRQVNVSKNALSVDEFVGLCAEVVQHHSQGVLSVASPC